LLVKSWQCFENDLMNLEWKHFPLLVLGGAIGCGLGWLLSFCFKSNLLPDGAPFGTHGAVAIFGAIAGSAVAVVTIVVRAARDPNAGPARNFTRINGMGSTLIGHSDPRGDGSYVATEWFTLVWIPIFPVCRYRVTNHIELGTPFWELYTIHEKMPPRFIDAARVYGVTLLVSLVLICIGYIASR
jgi:hypothetical protein